MSSQLDKLEQLARLRDAGVLTGEEFEAQKALILSGAAAAEPAPVVAAVSAPQPGRATPPAEAGPAVATKESELSQDALFNVFTAIDSAMMARALTKLGVVAAIVVFLDEAVRFGALVSEANTGPLSAEFSNETGLAVAVAMLLFWVGLSSLLAWRILKTASRGASIGLVTLTLVGAVANFPDVFEGGLLRFWWLASGFALLSAVQAMRGAFALRRFRSEV